MTCNEKIFKKQSDSYHSLHAPLIFSAYYQSIGGIKHMKLNLFATCILALALVGVASAQSAASSAQAGVQYTKAQVKELALNAHSPEQYSVLASYYAAQKADYLQQAAAEKKEWERRSQNITGVLAKYPRPVDSARNLYEYYIYKASEAGMLEAKYHQMVTPNAPVNAE
jgi:hypothetical protein